MMFKDFLNSRLPVKSQASYVEFGYGQVEPNHLSAQRTGQIYAQLPAAPSIDILEQGQFVKYGQFTVQFFFLRFGKPAFLSVQDLFGRDPLVKPFQSVKRREDLCSPGAGHGRMADAKLRICVMFRTSHLHDLPVGKISRHGHVSDNGKRR